MKSSPNKLSRREVQVASLVARGLCNKEIAASLGLETDTIKVYVTRIFQKTGHSNRAQLAVWFHKAERDGQIMDKAQEWRSKGQAAAQESAVDLTLPSGVVIRARRPGPLFIAAYGRLPLTLTAEVSEHTAPAPSGREDATHIEFLRDLLKYCVLEPAISLHPGPGEIHPHDIPNEDTAFILNWAIRGEEADRLASFRTERNDGGDSGDSEDLLSASKRADGDPRPSARPEFRPRGNGRHHESD